MIRKVGLCIVLFVVLAARYSFQTLQDDIDAQINDTDKSLSRKRRYLIFPEGSSLQLVFCFTMPALGMGKIFTIGSTVALAWALPHDPFEPFRRPSELLHRIDKPGKHTTGGWTVQNSKLPTPVTYTKTYYNPFLVNKPPAVAYSTIKGYSKLTGTNPGFTTLHTKKKGGYYSTPGKNYNQFGGFKSTGLNALNAYNQQRKKTLIQPVTTYLHPVYHKVYRRTRRDLYSKIEKLFTGLSRDGRACLFKAICEVSQATQERGSFIEEIIKAVFRVRHHEDQGHDERDEFDLAANKQHNCTEMYPTCEHSIWHDMFSFS